MTDEQLLYFAYLQRKRRVQLLDSNFPHQTNFVNDPARLKALFCTRRAAKSYTGGLCLVSSAIGEPSVNCLYIGLTRMSAEGIIWKDVIKDINKRHELGMGFNGSKLTATLPNESTIYVTGADADDDEMEKLLGKKYKCVVIDEVASFKRDLRRLIYGILKPATVDNGGTICLMGTSGNLTKGLFYDITNNKEPGWKLFEWTAHDNPHVAKQWQEELDDIALNRPLFMQTPLFKQWYLNQWVVDDDARVYKFDSSRNLYSALPHYSRGAWSYVLGVDLGYEDASAFVLCAFHEHDKILYIVETFKKIKMDITDVAEKIKAFGTRYDIFRVVVDGANKQAVEEIRKRHGIALHAADKTGKSDFIEIMNAELIQARIKIYEPASTELVNEWLGLIWDDKSVKRQEHPNCENHLADAALYAWRYCYQFLSEQPKPVVDMRRKDAWLAHTKELMDQSLEKQIERQKAQENESDMWNLQGIDSEENVLSYYLNKRRGQ